MKYSNGECRSGRLLAILIVIGIGFVVLANAHAAGPIPHVSPDHPMLAGGVDRRPHIPLILEMLNPMIKDVASGITRRLPPENPAMKCVELLNGISAEVQNSYLLSMAMQSVSEEAEETYKRVKDLKEQVDRFCK